MVNRFVEDFVHRKRTRTLYVDYADEDFVRKKRTKTPYVDYAEYEWPWMLKMI